MSPFVAYWHLARPRMLPFVWLLAVFGFAWAHWDRALQLRGSAGLGWVCAAWALLHAGTLWLNAVLDRDEGEVLLGRAVPVPRGATRAGYTALAATVPLAFVGHPLAGLAAVGCVVLAVLYSHPATAWKGHPIGGPLVNLVGYGLLTPLAGWSVVDVPANPRTLVVWALFGIGILSPYLLAQAFQGDEDRARGYRTAVVALGPQRTLQLARLALAVVLVGGTVLAVVGWFPRVCLVALPLWLWIDDLLRQWARLPDGGSAEWALRFARRVLVAVAVMVGACFVEYARQSYAQEPVAGLGTVAGLPPDRPALPPGQLRVWEVRHGGVVLD
jgi:1,4-dihydroxy-2-naphthoate octaprenyltransferase